MKVDGVMQQVGDLLSQGKSSREVIKLGYAPGTVYKVKREMRSDRTVDRSDIALTGHLWVTHDEEHGVVATSHLEPAVECPACGDLVVHWVMCHHCNLFIPEECGCSGEDCRCAGGFTFQELLKVE